MVRAILCAHAAIRSARPVWQGPRTAPNRAPSEPRQPKHPHGLPSNMPHTATRRTGMGLEDRPNPLGGAQRRMLLGAGTAPRVRHPAPNPPAAAPRPAGGGRSRRAGRRRRPPPRAREVGHRSGASTDGARICQSGLAPSLWSWHRHDAGQLRPLGRATLPSRIARLARLEVCRRGLVDEESASADRDQCHVSPKFSHDRGRLASRSAEPIVGPWSSCARRCRSRP